MDIKFFLNEYKGTHAIEWENQRGFIQYEYWQTPWGEQCSLHVEYVVLDDDTIAYRQGGDYTQDGDWDICNIDRFFELIEELLEEHPQEEE